MQEVKQRMSLAELATWQAYVDENGPLNLPLRIDAAVGRALLPFLKRGTKLKDLMPFPVTPEPPATAENLFNLIKGLNHAV